MQKYANILKVPLDATDEELHRAYRKLASIHHPDLGGDKDQFQRIQKAYERLLESRRRAERQRRHPQPQTRPQPQPVPRADQGRNQAWANGSPTQRSVQQPPQRSAPHQPHRTNRKPQRRVPPHPLKTPIDQRPRRGLWGLITSTLPLQEQTTMFIFVNVLDIFMTYILIRAGAIESNPIAHYFLKNYNFDGMIFFKLSIVSAVCIIAQIIACKSIKKAKRLLTAGSWIVGAVVLYSLWLYTAKFM